MNTGKKENAVRLHGYRDRRTVALGSTIVTVDLDVEEHRNGNFEYWIDRLNYRHNNVKIYTDNENHGRLIAVDYHGVTVGDASTGDHVYRVFSY